MQLKQMQNMGGLGALAGMLPGMKKAKAAMTESGVDDKLLLHMDAIIGSMTAKERAKPELLNAKRKRRIAAGSGTEVQDINRLLKMHQEMERVMKQMRKMGGLKGLGALLGGGGGGGMGGLGGLGGMLGGGKGMGGMGGGNPLAGLPGLSGGLGGKGGLPDLGDLPPDLQKLLKK
jgi:signal recognition particle subunit SRP54